MMTDSLQPAYDKAYLSATADLHRALYAKLNSDIYQYNIFDSIDAYMRTSQIRKRMDEGNWSALNKGYKQLINDIDFSNVKSDSVKTDGIFLHWLADIYTYVQWKYNLSTKYISEKLPARTMLKLYDPLHEASIDNASMKLYEIYLNG